MTEEDPVDLRLELDGIKVSGRDVPKPVQKWSHCGLTRPILDTIDQLALREADAGSRCRHSPIIMSGRDVIGVAKTGSGKSDGFPPSMASPASRHQEPVSGDRWPHRPHHDADQRAGCSDPSRLQAIPQSPLTCALSPPMEVLPIKDQIAELKRGAEIVVATPGRMIDLLAANQGRVTNLRRVTYIVLDEADRMFDMGFEPQVMKIFGNASVPTGQTILFSPTMPRIIDALTKKVLREPVEITVGGRERGRAGDHAGCRNQGRKGQVRAVSGAAWRTLCQ